MSKVGSHELSANGKGIKKIMTAKAKSQQGSGGGKETRRHGYFCDVPRWARKAYDSAREIIISKLQDMITQREIEDAILQMLRTQPSYSSITF